MWTAKWTVKASKLCQLRCRYCYEWNELGDPRRMSMADWERVLQAIAEQYATQVERVGDDGRVHIHWHGGEPLLLPRAYFDDVLRLQERILGTIPRLNFLQTNLYTLDEDKLELLVRERFELGVSFDVVDGPRRDAAGRDSRARVLANLDRIAARGLTHYGAVVLGRHTAARLDEVHDFWAQRGVGFTLFPMSASPLALAGESYALSDVEVFDALRSLFEHMLARGLPIVVRPLQGYLETALMHLCGVARVPYDRRTRGDRLLVVETDGRVFPIADRGGDDLGSLFEHSFHELLGSDAYARSLARDDRRRGAACGACPWRGACDTHPLFAEPWRGGCRVAAPMIGHMVDLLRAEGLDAATLRALARHRTSLRPDDARWPDDTLAGTSVAAPRRAARLAAAALAPTDDRAVATDHARVVGRDRELGGLVDASDRDEVAHASVCSARALAPHMPIAREDARLRIAVDDRDGVAHLRCQR